MLQYAHGTDNSIAGSTPHSFDGTESPIPAETDEDVALPPTPTGRCSPRLEVIFFLVHWLRAGNKGVKFFGR